MKVKRISFFLAVGVLTPLLGGCLLSDDRNEYQAETIRYQDGNSAVLSTRSVLMTKLKYDKDAVIVESKYEVRTCLEADLFCESWPMFLKCLCGFENQRGKTCSGEKEEGIDEYNILCDLDSSWIHGNKKFYLLLNYLKDGRVEKTIDRSPLFSAESLGLEFDHPDDDDAQVEDEEDAGEEGAGAGEKEGDDDEKIDLVGNNPFNLADAAKAPVDKASGKGGGCFNLAGGSPSLADFLFLGIGLAGLYLRRGFRRK